MRIQEIHNEADLERLAVLAAEIWTEHYTPIIGPDQVRYMLEHFQNAEAMRRQIESEGYRYFVAEENGRYHGYCALRDEKNGSVFLSKLYIEKSCRGQGLGRLLLRESLDRMNPAPESVVWLTVNRNNAASIAAYRKIGFAETGEVTADIGNGFFMEDYRMEIPVSRLKQTDESLTELISAATISVRVRELGAQISRDFVDAVKADGQPLIVLGILKGSFIFLADLTRSLSIPVDVEFASLSSYGDEKRSSGTVQMQLSPRIDLKDRRVLVVEDIVDTGLTLSTLLDHLGKAGAREVRVCTLLDKTEARATDVPVDYVGFAAPLKFVVGYGLDAAQAYRQLPGLYELK